MLCVQSRAIVVKIKENILITRIFTLTYSKVCKSPNEKEQEDERDHLTKHVHSASKGESVVPLDSSA
ncbi:hypothetical protein PV327_002803 [Microctonus hyperodae]|uniref:Uncharacterized protein n=1 Tax=Microctonus hyperodae TaxID=165561 RepID=A0AA39FGJ8_MICHY|nr:hypothetical protein PV327_002803 [Microctonus hyperodae]